MKKNLFFITILLTALLSIVSMSYLAHKFEIPIFTNLIFVDNSSDDVPTKKDKNSIDKPKEIPNTDMNNEEETVETEQEIEQNTVDNSSDDTVATNVDESTGLSQLNLKELSDLESMDSYGYVVGRYNGEEVFGRVQEATEIFSNHGKPTNQSTFLVYFKIYDTLEDCLNNSFEYLLEGFVMLEGIEGYDINSLIQSSITDFSSYAEIYLEPYLYSDIYTTDQELYINEGNCILTSIGSNQYKLSLQANYVDFNNTPVGELIVDILIFKKNESGPTD